MKKIRNGKSKKGGSDGKRIRKLFSGQAAVSSFGNNISQPYIPYYLIKFKASEFQMGMFQALQNLFPNVLQLYWGYLSDKVRRRLPFIIIGTVAASLLLYSITFTTNVTVIIVVLAVSAAIASMGAPAWSALMGDRIKHRHRGKNFSHIANYSLVAGLLGTIAVLFIFSAGKPGDITPYKWLFIAGAVIGLVSLVFVLPIKDRKKNRNHRKDKINGKNDNSLKILKPSQLDGDFRYFLWAQGAYNFFMSMGWPLFYVTQAEILGASNIDIALIAFVGIGATIAFQPLVGKLIDKTGPVWFITASRYLLIIVPFTYAFATSIYQIFILNIVIGLASAAINVAFSTYILDISPPDTKAEYFAYYNLTCGIAGFFGSIFAGLLADSLKPMWGLWMALLAVYMICGFGRIVTSFFFLKIKNPKRYPSTPRQLAAAYWVRVRGIWKRP
jgi:MFS family permease